MQINTTTLLNDQIAKNRSHDTNICYLNKTLPNTKLIDL